MTLTLISMISISAGIAGANLLAILKKKYTMGFTGNTVAGIFGSIFFIKSFGRFGFDPFAIMETGVINYLLFTTNMFISLLGGAIALFITKLVTNKMNKDK
jgi:uncharacterized membrane protein YeaQ/YmgE (transglycosylase-associated protein family)